MADDEAAEVRQIWSALGLPGVIDVHTHFMPKSVMDKVWQYFDSEGRWWVVNGRSTIGQLSPNACRCCGNSACAASPRWSIPTNRGHRRRPSAGYDPLRFRTGARRAHRP